MNRKQREQWLDEQLYINAEWDAINGDGEASAAYWEEELGMR